MKTKICKTCGLEKDTTEFRVHRGGWLQSSCHNCELLYKRKYRQTNKVKISIYKKELRNKQPKNPRKRTLTKLEYDKIYRKTHQQLRTFYQVNRRCAKLKRTPSYADLKEIKDFYKNCPKGMVVDHIIPLQGKIVSGFHILKNLQYISQEENLKKGNKFPYYPLDFYREKGLI